MIRQYIQAIIAVCALAVLIAVGITGYHFGANSVLAKQVKDDVRLEAVEQRATAAAAVAISGIKVQNRTIYNQVQHETTVVPDYSLCHQSADGLRSVNAALAGESAPAGDSGLPTADPAR